MKTKLHAAAGVIGFLTILTFWTSTVASELFGGPAAIAAVKGAILWGLIVLVPSLAIAGATGMALAKGRGRGRAGAAVAAKRKRMPFIALNGLLVLVPSAIFLALRAEAGTFDVVFFAVQAVELAAGAVNLVLIGLNIRDGLRMTGRLGRHAPV